MAILKGRLVAGRIEVDHGLDFTRVKHLPGLDTGNEIKFHSGALLGSNPGTTGEWEKGILVSGTLDEGTYTTEYKGKYASVFTIEANTTSTRDGHTNAAALRIDYTREADYAHSGGSEDIAVKINATNYAVCTGMRAFTLEATNRTAQATVLQGALITAHQRNTGGFTTGMYGARIVSKNRQPGGGTGYQHALIAADESDGVQPSENSIVWIEKQSNSYTAATKAGLEIVNNANTSYSSVITHGIYFKCGATNSNITNAFGFDSSDGTEGATLYAGTITGSGNMVRIAIKVATVTYYILAHASVDH